MCIIIDANAASEFVPTTEDALPIVERIKAGSVRLVSGHKIKEELLGCPFRSVYRQLLLAGRLTEFDDGLVENEVQVVRTLSPKSDDAHVLALARVSGARILYSRDQNLHADFKNKQLINGPRGKIYQSHAHAHLLDEVPCHCD